MMLVALCREYVAARLCLPGLMSLTQELKADHHDTVQFKHYNRLLIWGKKINKNGVLKMQL